MNQKLMNRIEGQVRNLCSPDLVMVFGSYARGEENKNSDLDLIVVCKELFRRKMLERQIQTRLKKYGLKSDVLLRTHDEMADAMKDKKSFLGTVLKKGKIIYKKDDFSLLIDK